MLQQPTADLHGLEATLLTEGPTVVENCQKQRPSNSDSVPHEQSPQTDSESPQTDSELRDLALQQLKNGKALQKIGYLNLSPSFNATLKMSSLPSSAQNIGTNAEMLNSPNPVGQQPLIPVVEENGELEEVSGPGSAETDHSSAIKDLAELRKQLSSGTVVFKPLHEVSANSDDSPFDQQLTRVDAHLGHSKLDDFDDKSLVELVVTRREKSPRILLWVFLILSAGCLVPATVFAIIGSVFSTKNFFTITSPNTRVGLLEVLNSKYGFSTASQNMSSGIFLAFLDSQFTPHFDGINYSPIGLSTCSFSQEEAENDVLLLSKLTSRVRTYSSACDQARYLLSSIASTKLPLRVSLGLWLSPDETKNHIELMTIKKLVADFPEKSIESIFVGDEVNYRGDILEDHQIHYIRSLKDYIKEIGKNIPVGTSEAAGAISAKVARECDFIGVNINPFREGIPVELATDWILQLIEQHIEPLVPLTTRIIISEVGWPSYGGSQDLALATLDASNHFMRSWLCDAGNRTRGKYNWYYHEAFDHSWWPETELSDNAWEGHWGILSSDKQLKEHAVLPVCR